MRGTVTKQTGTGKSSNAFFLGLHHTISDLLSSTLKHLYDNNITNNIMMSGDSQVSTAHYCSHADC